MDRFFCFRQQRVVVNGVKSDWAPVLWAPFLVPCYYINDISSDIESEIRLFADDCVCYHEIKDEKDTMKLQRDITDTFLSAAEGAEDSVAKFTSLVRARD